MKEEKKKKKNRKKKRNIQKEKLKGIEKKRCKRKLDSSVGVSMHVLARIPQGAVKLSPLHKCGWSFFREN